MSSSGHHRPQIPLQSAGNALRRAVAAHLEAHKKAHGTSRIKPKNHWLFDIASQIERHPVVLDTFVVERLHQRIKPLAAQVQNTQVFERSVLSSVLTRHHNDLTEGAFCSGGLLGPSAPLPGSLATVAGALEISGLRLSARDVVFRADACAQIAARCREGDSLFIFAALMNKAGDLSAHSGWWRPSGNLALWAVGQVDVALAWRQDGDRLFVVRS